MSDESRITASSGNVYADLGFEDPDLELAKADLAHQIVRILQERKLTQQQAGAILGIDQPKVSALINGRLGLFSTERLMRFLTRLERNVEITVSTKESGGSSARIAVVSDLEQTSARRRASERKASVIRRDPGIMGGTPVFAGTRVPIDAMIDYLKTGDTLDEFLDQFPTVSRDRAVAALEELAEGATEIARAHRTR